MANEETKKQLFWVLYIIGIIVIFVIILFVLKGCNTLREGNYDKIITTNDWVTNMWNKCVDPIYWYGTDGTGIEGATINIDEVLTNCDLYYKEFDNHTKYVNSLTDEHKDFKDYYGKISEQINIIYPKIKATTPMPKMTLGYESNIEIYYEYQLKLYNVVKDKYTATK